MAINTGLMTNLADKALSSLEAALGSEVPIGDNAVLTHINAKEHFKETIQLYDKLNLLILQDAFHEHVVLDNEGKDMVLIETEPEGVGKLRIASLLALDILNGYINSYDGNTHKTQDLSLLREKSLVQTKDGTGKKGYLGPSGYFTPYAFELGLQRNNQEILELIKSFYK